MTLKNPPTNHKYQGTSVVDNEGMPPFCNTKKNNNPNNKLLMEVKITASIGCLSMLPNWELNPAWIAKNTPPINAKSVNK